MPADRGDWTMTANILLIDDDLLVRSTLEDTLCTAGFNVVTAVNGANAEEVVRGNPVDLVITDIMMPQVNGIETIRRLREQHGAVKILAISGGGPNLGTGLLDLARKIGADRSLPKPFMPNDLLNTIREMLH
jgi:DNA-binding response OmpR family regulator